MSETSTPQPILPEDFQLILHNSISSAVLAGIKAGGALAVAVSGGPDSLALAALLATYTGPRQEGGAAAELHVLIVDHGLRAESAGEAAYTQELISKHFPHVKAEILTWGKANKVVCSMDGDVKSLQEQARKARYGLMATYCRAHAIRYLFLGHHQDDQAETVLFRLARGSGLDGLGGMRPLRPYDNDLMLVRPLLDIPKDRLVATCNRYGLEPIKDPSNESDSFYRGRIRKSMEVLEGEGLSAKRLSVTARRMQRAAFTLDRLAAAAYEDCKTNKNSKRIVLNFELVRKQDEEIALRVLLRAISELRPQEDYLPRMEKIEVLADDLRNTDKFRRRTLGGLVFSRDDKMGEIEISLEK